MSNRDSAPECWLLDLDGVLWRANETIAGSPEAVKALIDSGRRVAFYTNNSMLSSSALLANFQAHGYLDIDPDLVFSSSRTAANLLQAGEKAFVIGGEGIREALTDVGVDLVSQADLAATNVDAVVVGLDPSFDYARLAAAMTALARGARLIGTNDDASYPTPHGLIPGGGSILAAIAYASSMVPIIAGKPYQPTVDLLEQKLGVISVAVGDRPSSDGLLAQRLGARFALVRSGVTPAGALVSDVPVAFDEPDLMSVVKHHAG